MFDEAGAIGIIAEELDSHAKSHVQVARAAMSGLRLPVQPVDATCTAAKLQRYSINTEPGSRCL